MRAASFCLLTVSASLLLAASPAPAQTPARPDLLIEIQTQFPAAKKWFGMVADLDWELATDGSLTPRYETLRSRFVLPRDSAGQKLFARLPRLSTGPHEVWVADQKGLSVRTEEADIPPVEAELLRGMVIYRGAVAGGDLLYKLTPTHADEYIYFRDPPATLRRDFEFDMGGGVARLRQAGRVIELIGKDGAAHLRLSAPVARAADGKRRNGTVRLEGNRLIEEIDLSGLTAPILVDPDWSTTGTMTVAHWADFSWRLADATVMAVGGCALASCPIGLATSSCNQVLATTDIWTPGAGTWTAGPPLLAGRYSYAGVVLAGGELLVAGGCTATGCQTTTAAAERYSFAQKEWLAAGTLPKALANATGAPLPGGDALVPGGCDEKACFPDAARFLAASNTWKAVAPMGGPRGYATTTALPDGTVVVIGGCADAACATVLAGAELYDPKSDKWRAAGGMTIPRSGHTATLLDDGTVLVTGGCSEQGCKGTTLDSADVWAPDAKLGGTFTAVAKMSAPRHHHTATRLENGEILVAGGADGSDATRAAADVYMPIGKHFIEAPRMMMSRAYHTATGLSSGDVLVAGGCNPATCLPWAEVFSPDGLPVEVPDGGLADSGPPIEPPDASTDYGPALPVSGGPHPKLMRTGAVSCSTDTVQDLPCPIAGWPAQDGQFQPNQRPMQPVGDTDTADLATGLVWQSRDDKNTYTQAQAIAACATYATDSAGAGAWRLPTVVELFTINLYGAIAPSMDQAFPDAQQTNYWTATAVAGSTMLGWTVKFDAGEVVPLLKDSALPIRCVRGELPGPKAGGDHLRLAGPYTATDITVRDEANVLEWQRKDDGVKRTWRESLDYCAKLSLGDNHDWHLPNTFELLSIVEYNTAAPLKIDPIFQETKGDIYWTGTFNEGIPTLSWSITFNLGVADGVTYSGKAFARCVRHIQPAPRPANGSDCGCRLAGDSEPGGGPAFATLLGLGVVAALRRRRRARIGHSLAVAGLLGALPLALLGCSDETAPPAPVTGDAVAGMDCAQDGYCPGKLRCFPDWRCYAPTASPTCTPACYGALPLCNTAQLRCVACLADSDCGPGTVCDTGLGRCVSGCNAGHMDCAEATQTCDPDAGVCHGCLGDGDCTDPKNPRCNVGSGTCVACLSDSDTCPLGQYCASVNGDAACVQGCKAKADCGGTSMDCCNHTCVDVTSDGNNCGGCGLPCSGNQTCCATGCADLTTDVENCSACGHSCVLPNVASIVCSAGSCSNTGCESYFADCDKNLANGCEVNLTMDPENCYSCGNVCTAFPHAMAGCTVSGCSLGTCFAGWADCDKLPATGCEYAVAGFDSDPKNCGGCGVACGAKMCKSGSCI